MTLEQAEQLCIIAHKDQLRRDGITPYHCHPFAVADIMTTVDEKIVALLHDMLEDTDFIIEELSPNGLLIVLEPCYDGFKPILVNDNIATLTDKQANALHLLTKCPSQSYDDYLQDISKNKLATKVKIADMFHNLSDSPTDHQKQKYLRGLQILLDTST